MKNRRTIKIVSGVLSLIGLIAPFIADSLEGEIIDQEIEEKVAEILEKKGVVSK